MGLSDIVSLIGQAGVTGLLILALFTALRGDWVSRREHTAALAAADARLHEMTADRDFWRKTAEDRERYGREIQGANTQAVVQLGGKMAAVESVLGELKHDVATLALDEGPSKTSGRR